MRLRTLNDPDTLPVLDQRFADMHPAKELVKLSGHPPLEMAGIRPTQGRTLAVRAESSEVPLR